MSARVEAGNRLDASVSLDLFIRGLLAPGASSSELLSGRTRHLLDWNHLTAGANVLASRATRWLPSRVIAGWGLYSMLMGNKTHKDIPGIAFLVDSRGRRTSVLIDLEQHGSLWEDLYDAYIAQQRRTEPRESLATVKRLLQSPSRRRGRG